MEIRPALKSIFREFLHFRLENRPFVKLLGDGLLFIKEVDNRNTPRTANAFLETLLKFSDRMRSLIEAMPTYPRPDGFRVRVTYGMAHSLVVAKNSKSKATDYFAYEINLASRLLKVRPELPFIAHRSVFELLSQKLSAEIEFRDIEADIGILDGVDQEDLAQLCEVKLKSGSEKT